MSQQKYAAKDLFSYINLEENEDLTIEQYLTHSKNGNERKYRTKKFREKYQKSVRILHRIFSTYYPSEEITVKLFPSFKKGLLKSKAEKRETRKNPITEDWEIVKEDIPNIDEKVWNGLEFIFLLIIFSSIQKELPSNVDVTSELSLRKSSRDSKEESDFFSLEKTNFDKNKYNIMNNLHKDIETVLDALRIIENQQTKKIDQLNFQEDDGFNDEEVVGLIYNVTCDFSIDILTKHVLFFYQSYIRCLFPDFCQQQKEMKQRLEQQKQTLDEIVVLSQTLMKQIEAFQENYDEKPINMTEPIQNIIKELTIKKNWQKQYVDYRDLYQKSAEIQFMIETIITKF